MNSCFALCFLPICQAGALACHASGLERWTGQRVLGTAARVAMGHCARAFTLDAGTHQQPATADSRPMLPGRFSAADWTCRSCSAGSFQPVHAAPLARPASFACRCSRRGATPPCWTCPPPSSSPSWSPSLLPCSATSWRTQPRCRWGNSSSSILGLHFRCVVFGASRGAEGVAAGSAAPGGATLPARSARAMGSGPAACAGWK